MKHLVLGRHKIWCSTRTYRTTIIQYTSLSHFLYFFEDLDIASYANADDTTIYTVKENKESVINTLEASSLPLFT